MRDCDTSLPCILIVDDDPDQLFLTRNMLEKAEVRHPLVEIGGGQEAMWHLAGCCECDGTAKPGALPALIFLDLRMPVADGFAVLQWIRSKPALGPVKVIILSSSDGPEDVARAMALGAQGFLVKHPSPCVVACVLREALRATAAPFAATTTQLR